MSAPASLHFDSDGNTESGTTPIGASSTTEPDALIEGMLAIARRETLVLAASSQRGDVETSAISASRIRWMLTCAQEFAAQSLSRYARTTKRIGAVREAAERWFPTHPRAALGLANRQTVLDKLLYPAPPFEPIDASNVLLIDLDLDDLPLNQLALRGATVTNVQARRARLEGMDAAGAKLTRALFHAASLRRAGFEESTVEDCGFSVSNLEFSRWSGARVTRCAAVRAVLIDARIENATFIDCDFRGANFQASGLQRSMGIVGAKFLRCDLRGTSWQSRSLRRASFINCRLCGVRGAVDVAEAVIEQPDLSPEGDGSQLGVKDDIVNRWSCPEQLAVYAWQ